MKKTLVARNRMLTPVLGRVKNIATYKKFKHPQPPPSFAGQPHSHHRHAEERIKRNLHEITELSISQILITCTLHSYLVTNNSILWLNWVPGEQAPHNFARSLLVLEYLCSKPKLRYKKFDENYSTAMFK